MEMLNKQRSKRHPALPGSYLAENRHFILHCVTSIIDVTSFIDYVDYNGTTDLKETTHLVLYVGMQMYCNVQCKSTLSYEKGTIYI